MSIIVEKLTHIYMPETPFEKVALNSIDLELESGRFYAIMGHTGSGKSTLIQHFNGLLKPTSGSIKIEGEDIAKANMSEIRKKVGLVFQYPEYQLFEETIEKDVAFGLIKAGVTGEEVTKRVKKALEIVGLDYDTYKDVSPFELSGGQKRRVAIAGIIVMEPKILILDEPTAGLDPRGRDEILGTIKSFQKDHGMTVVLVSHSMEDIAKIAEEIIVMAKGECILKGTPSEVFSNTELLEKIGLSAPKVTYLVKKLRDKGVNIPKEIYTIEEVAEYLAEYLKNKKRVLD